MGPSEPLDVIPASWSLDEALCMDVTSVRGLGVAFAHKKGGSWIWNRPVFTAVLNFGLPQHVFFFLKWLQMIVFPSRFNTVGQNPLVSDQFCLSSYSWVALLQTTLMLVPPD